MPERGIDARGLGVKDDFTQHLVSLVGHAIRQ
jgi:hypothetical protein